MGKCAAGVFTQPYATQLVLAAFENAVKEEVLEKDTLTMRVVRGFLGEFGRKFYGEARSRRKIRITNQEERVMEVLEFGRGGQKVVPFGRTEPVYSLEWI